MTTPKKPKGKRMAENPIRVTQEVHSKLKLLSAAWNCTISDVVNTLIVERVPSIDEAVSKAKELENMLKASKPDNLN